MPPLVAALPYIVAGAAVVGTGVSVASAVEQGEEQRKAARFQARELQIQAQEAEQEAGIKLAAQDERSIQILSSIRASAAASGVVPDVGSPLATYETSSEQARLNEMYTKYAGNIQAQGLQTEAALTTYGGEQAKTASYYTAGGDVVSGFGRLGETILKNPKAFGLDASIG